jgi:hypothetical protein
MTEAALLPVVFFRLKCESINSRRNRLSANGELQTRIVTGTKSCFHLMDEMIDLD